MIRVPEHGGTLTGDVSIVALLTRLMSGTDSYALENAESILPRFIDRKPCIGRR
ncbi:MAG: hypothetical protein ACTSV9_05420 [Candidatus Thorarchaeota archaeon]